MREHPVKGIVLEVRSDSVVLDHEPIAGVMSAMVMELRAPSDALRVLRPGDRVEAVMKIGGGPTRLDDIAVVSHGAVPEPPARPWSAGLMVGEVLERAEIETVSGPVVVGAGQGRVTVLTFLFVRCPVPEFCPLLASKLAALQHRIGDARIVAVTLDPEHDTPEDLAAYGERFGADPAIWVLGRLDPKELSVLLDRVDVETRVEAGTLTHNLRLLVLDGGGRLVHREKDNAWDVEAVGEIVRQLPR